MAEFTKERLMALSNIENVGAICGDEIVSMARQLLASIEQEPVAYAPKGHIDRYLRGDNSGCWVYGHPVSDDDERLYRASQISPFDRRAIASKVQGLCSRLPGATFANAAEFALDEIEAPTGQEPESQFFKFLTLEHIRVIEMLLSVCGAAFELADDSCQQQVDGEDCHIVPDTSFAKLSVALGEIENTLPYELPDTILQWAAIPRYALRGILYSAPQLPQPAVGELTAETLPDEIKQMPAATAFVWMDGWNKACRAAMLQGAEPVQAWIPCSERMPEQKKRVLVSNNKSQDVHIGLLENEGSRYFFIGNQLLFNATHWMEIEGVLPAAPQQEVDNG